MNGKHTAMKFMISILGVLLIVSVAQGQETPEEPENPDRFVLYDGFLTPYIDFNRWSTRLTPERFIHDMSRHVVEGRLVKRLRIHGGSDENTGLVAGSNRMTLRRNRDAIVAVRFEAEMVSLQVVGCPGLNPEPSKALMGFLGTLFYDGSFREEDDFTTGNVFALLRVFRESSSTQLPGILTIEGVVFRCGNSDCSNQEEFGVVSLGQATVGVSRLYTVRWDLMGGQVSFQVDDEAPQTVFYSANVNRVGGSKTLLTRSEAAKCMVEQDPFADTITTPVADTEAAYATIEVIRTP